ncbi:MAG: 4'-phosphopantetheinyl transferase superfamily protein [Cyclobacteriaceae bacterium]
MPPIFKDISPHAAYALWHVGDSIEKLQNAYLDDIPDEIANYHPNKQIEYLASRILIRLLCKHVGIGYCGIFKDENGKPHLKESTHHISISHSYPVVACMVDKQGPCGIDIETPRKQLIKIQRKFLNKEEQKFANNDLERLCQLWCAKEALYKLYGRKKLVFPENLSVNFSGDGQLSGEIKIGGYHDSVALQVENLDGHFVVYSL